MRLGDLAIALLASSPPDALLKSRSSGTFLPSWFWRKECPRPSGGVSGSNPPDLRVVKNMAEREGFEPSRRGLATYAISSRVPSASSDTSPVFGSRGHLLMLP